MAFVAPLLTELGIFISESLVAEGVNTTAAGAASGFAVSQVSSAIENAADSLARNVLGDENVNWVEDTVNSAATHLQNTGYSLFYQDSSYLAPATKPTTKPTTKPQPIMTPVGQQYRNHLNGLDDADVVKSTSSPVISYGGKKVMEVIIQHATAIAFTEDKYSLINIVKNDPVKLSIAQRLHDYYARTVVPSNDTYKQIASVYNGRSFVFGRNNTVVRSFDTERGLYKFNWVDELGDSFEMYQTTGIILPAVWGTFGGARSANANEPQDLIDEFFCAHDRSYVDNMFNLIGDYQLVSRLSSNFDRMGSDPERRFARTSIIYFSTVGHTIATLKGSLSGDIGKVVIPDLTKDDIYPVMNPDAYSMTDNDYIHSRCEWYKELNSGFKESTVNHGMFSAGAAPFRLKQEFANMMIELL